MSLWQKIWNDGRNLCEWFTDKTKVEVEWAKYIIDLRCGFLTAGGKWTWILIRFWKPVQQNFWNGVLTLNLYLIKSTLRLWTLSLPLILPRVNLVVRPERNNWFQFGAGWLFDRGTFAFKCIIANWTSEEKYNPGVNARNWEEGAV